MLTFIYVPVYHKVLANVGRINARTNSRLNGSDVWVESTRSQAGHSHRLEGKQTLACVNIEWPLNHCWMLIKHVLTAASLANLVDDYGKRPPFVVVATAVARISLRPSARPLRRCLPPTPPPSRIPRRAGASVRPIGPTTAWNSCQKTEHQ